MADAPLTLADAHLRALLHYTSGFYGTAMEHGMPAASTANAVAHVESAARALHKLATAAQPQPPAAALTDEQIEAAKKKTSAEQTPFDAGCEVLDYLRTTGASPYYTSRMLACLHGTTHKDAP